MDSSVKLVMNSEEEIALIDCILAGQSSKFEILVGNYQQRIYATALAMLGNAQDAEDVTQETFIKAFRMLHQFERRSSLYTWLHRIAFNRAIDLQRRNKRTTRRCVGDEMLDSAPTRLDAMDSPDAIAVSNESVHRVQLALTRLHEERRNIIVLRDIQGLDYAEIAALLEMPIGTVRSRLHRARLELKEIMDGMGMGISHLDASVPGEQR